MSVVVDEVLAALNGANAQWQVTLDEGVLWVPANAIYAVCEWLKESDAYRMDYCANLTAVDYPESHIEVVYHLYSIVKKIGPILIKVKLPREHSTIDSVTPIWRGAEYQEREVFDLYGIDFTHHPDMRRILMWEDFEGAPMRKDYVVEDQDVLE